MLPIVDKPTIQYVVEEVVESGLSDVIFVTSQGKEAVEDHFDHDLALEQILAEKGDADLLEQVRRVSEMIAVSSIRQKRPLGLGHAVLVSEHLVGDETFAVVLGDDIISSTVPCTKQLLEVYEKLQASVIAVMEVPAENISRYGVVSVESADEEQGRLFRVQDLVEKPARREAPSNLAVIGRYVLTPRIFEILHQTPPGALGEIQLTDGIRLLLKEEPVYAYRFQGKRYDAGNKLEFVIATVEYARRHPEIGAAFRSYLRNLQMD